MPVMEKFATDSAVVFSNEFAVAKTTLLSWVENC